MGTIDRNWIDSVVNRTFRKYLERIEESRKPRAERERMLEDLFDYLAQEPDNDIYDGDKGSLNPMYKAYNYFEPKEIVHNEWCVHFTDTKGYEGILRRGFRIGVSNYDELAYSACYYGDDTKRKSGWNFALPLDSEDVGEYRGYGDMGFLIKTDGVRAYHKGDGDDEIIFRGCHVKKKIPFYYDDNFDCWVLCRDFPVDPMPEGSRYDEDMGAVVFDDIESMIRVGMSL